MDETPPDLPDAAWRRQLRRALLAWYRRHARDLPWRWSRDPYRIWVSEIMLQQTQVATVGPYFERFIAALPDVESLAAAEEDQVLRLWEGLGYYRRARQMHQAARVIVDEHHGRFPTDAAAARALPGIGRYTAGAILSIALDAAEPILEANTIRLLSRLLAYQGDPMHSAAQRLLWGFAQALLPRKQVGTFNQALMELGSQVCTPGCPSCGECPVASLCHARQQGLQDQIPPPKRKVNYQDVLEAALVIHRRGKVLLRRCEAGERWAGLWDFPRFAVAARRGAALHRQLIEGARELTGLIIAPGQRLTTIKHGVTRYRITLLCHRADYVRRGRQSRDYGELSWANPSQLDRFPLSSTGRKIGHLVVRENGGAK